jgi:uridine phosphorylase
MLKGKMATRLQTMHHRLDEKQIIIQPRRGRKDPQAGPDALMVMVPSQLKFIRRRTSAQKARVSDGGLWDYYLAAVDHQLPLTLTGPMVGAPQAVIVMEKLIALGAKRIWVTGWCGSLQPDVRIGDLVIPTGAHSEEGTSTHYPVPWRRPESDANLNRRLQGALRTKGLPFHTGGVWTTDAPYRETLEKVKRYQRLGVLAVEMEMSALMTVALFRAVSVAALLVVSDELFDLKWKPGFSDPLLQKRSRAAAEILLMVTSGSC